MRRRGTLLGGVGALTFIERQLVDEVLRVPIGDGVRRTFAEWLAAEGRHDDAARVLAGDALGVAVASVLAGDPGAAFTQLAPLLVGSATLPERHFERVRAEAILGAVELALGRPRPPVRGGPPGPPALDPAWPVTCGTMRALQHGSARPAYAELRALLGDAFGSAGLASARGVPWCAVERESGDEVLVYGFVYDQALATRAFYVRFAPAEDAGAHRWEAGLDPLDADGTPAPLPFDQHPCVGDAPEDHAWACVVRGQREAPLRPAPESLETWQRVFDAVTTDGDAVALCGLVERHGAVHANGHALDMLAVNTLGLGYMTERGIAAFVADLLNGKHGGGRQYTDYYQCTRGIHATAGEVRLFHARCAARGVVFADAAGAWLCEA